MFGDRFIKMNFIIITTEAELLQLFPRQKSLKKASQYYIHISILAKACRFIQSITLNHKRLYKSIHKRQP